MWRTSRTIPTSSKFLIGRSILSCESSSDTVAAIGLPFGPRVKTYVRLNISLSISNGARSYQPWLQIVWRKLNVSGFFMCRVAGIVQILLSGVNLYKRLQLSDQSPPVIV